MTTIADVLKGLKPGTIQSVGYMQIIPLLSEVGNDKYVLPTEVLISNRNYGEMQMENPTEGTLIIPFGMGVITRQSAQDHATPKAKILKRLEKAHINYAACIQQSQGGYLARGQHPMTILPWAIKGVALETRDDTNYGKLWGAITELNSSLGASRRGHLEVYLETFKDDLDTFIAQFEIIPNQVGAIVLINGYIVGIERTPNSGYFKALWRPLIRESYGSLVLQYRKKFGETPPIPKTRVPLKGSITSLEELKDALEVSKGAEDEIVKIKVRKLVKDKFTSVIEERVGNIQVQTLGNRQFSGQVVYDEDKIVYASFITTASGLKNADVWEADEFVI